MQTHAQTPVVHVVDDDADMRHSLKDLLELVGLVVKCYASAREFLDAYTPGVPGCLVVDIRLPGMSGPDLQQHLAQKRDPLPVIVFSGFADVPTTVRIMKAGARDVLEKTRSPQELLEAVQRAVAADVAAREKSKELVAVQERLQTLTPREREVLELVIGGRTSKLIAAELGISLNTVEIHRGRVMKKMEAETVADLVRLCLSARAEGEPAA